MVPDGNYTVYRKNVPNTLPKKLRDLIIVVGEWMAFNFTTGEIFLLGNEIIIRDDINSC